jgi:catechol 2,3-dioxygenase-like lactoylglutathione lyase family enzyme
MSKHNIYLSKVRIGMDMIKWAIATAFLAASTTAAHAVDRPAITSVSHLSVYTSDPAKTEHFYVHDLGATKGPDPQNPQGVRYYFNPIQFVEVLPLPSGSEPKSRFDHAAYNTANAEQMRQYLAAHGVRVPPAVTHGSDGSQCFEVSDPEGNRVQFVQPPAHPAAVPPNPLSNHIIHVGYIVHSPALEDTFYHDLLGFKPYWHGGATDNASDWISSQVPNGLDWVEYMTVKGPEQTGIPPTMSKDTAGVLDHFALGIQNAEQSMDLLYAGDRLNNKHADPKIGRDGKWQINMYDPDGIRAELMEFQPSVKPCCSPFLAASPTK